MLKKYSKTLLGGRFVFPGVIVLVGSVSWLLTMVKNGMPSVYGLGFWGPHGHDAVWHIALSQSLSRGTLEVPVLAGNALQNYHLGYDILLSLAHKLTGINLVSLYFIVFPLIISVIVGYLTYKFTRLWTGSMSSSIVATLFVYFGGSFGWIITLARQGIISGESMFWSQQAVSTLVNPPFAMSLIVVLLLLIFILKIDGRKPRLITLLGMGILIGVLVQIKAYAGLLSISGLWVLTLSSIALPEKRKNVRSLVLLSSVSTIIAAILLFSNTKSTGSLMIFQPFWFIETMLAVSDRLSWPKLYEAMINWRAAGMMPKYLFGLFVALTIFVVGNLGTRILSVIYILKFRRDRLTDTEIFIGSVVLAGMIIPVLFVQKGTPWNTIQFFYYSQFLLSIVTGVVVSEIIKNRKPILKYFVLAIVFILTIPTTLGTLTEVYLPSRPPAKLSVSEVEALNYLSKQPLGRVLTYPYSFEKARNAEASPPRPLYLYESTAYVSAFSKKPVILEDEVNLTIMGYDWLARRAEIDDFYNELDEVVARAFLTKYEVDYIYWVKPQRAALGETQLGLERIYENNEVDIYKVVR